MKTLRDLYKMGRGPSSSHTMAPERICRLFLKEHNDADSLKITLYGSLAMTGKGHCTDVVLKETASPIPCEIIFDCTEKSLPHPNTLKISDIRDGRIRDTWTAMSTGGGSFVIEGRDEDPVPETYPHETLSEIIQYCSLEGMRIWQYAEKYEGAGFWAYLKDVWGVMKKEIEDGLTATERLPGCLCTERKSKYLFEKKDADEDPMTRENRIVCAYAFAAAEQNASSAQIVTSPTCGSCGVLPAVLRYEQEIHGFTEDEILHALATAGIIGNLVKTNASISGAECGCQAEIGTACSMASAALAELFGMNYRQIEYASEVAMEHMLGLTCDPIGGLVQIPCIERNAIAAMRAINAVNLSNFLADTRKISFDLVVKTMYETGKDISMNYRETSKGGLAKLYNI